MSQQDYDTPPQDDDRPFEAFDILVECFLIGWCMRDKAAVAYAGALIGPNDFYRDAHQVIFERILAKQAAGRPVTPATIGASLKNNSDFQAIGGVAYLREWELGSPALVGAQLKAEVEDHARIVREFRHRREAIEATYVAWESLQQPGEIATALEPVVYLADREADEVDAESGSVMVKDAAYDVLTDLEKPVDPNAKALVAPTGLHQLNTVIGGLQPANLLVAGGRPGMGKSILGTLLARSSAAALFYVDYFSLEMTARELTIRLLCDLDYDDALAKGLKPIHYSEVLLRRLSRDQIERLATANLALAELPIEIHDRDELTIDQIASITRAKQAAKPGPRVVVIDHMHLIEPSDRYRGRKVDEISEVTKGAKRMAKRLGVSVALLAQLNREIEKREEKMPTMSDFRDAGSIEQDADVMVGLNRPAYWLARAHGKEDETARSNRQTQLIAKANVMEVGILKNRHGATADLTCFCDVASSVIRDEQPEIGGGIQPGLDFSKLGKVPF